MGRGGWGGGPAKEPASQCANPYQSPRNSDLLFTKFDVFVGIHPKDSPELLPKLGMTNFLGIFFLALPLGTQNYDIPFILFWGFWGVIITGNFTVLKFFGEFIHVMLELVLFFLGNTNISDTVTVFLSALCGN